MRENIGWIKVLEGIENGELKSVKDVIEMVGEEKVMRGIEGYGKMIRRSISYGKGLREKVNELKNRLREFGVEV